MPGWGFAPVDPDLFQRKADPQRPQGSDMTHLLAEVDDPVVLADIRQDLFSALPHLRAFAISLTGDVDRADDLVQETVVRALSHLHQFERGTNFQGWMFTILRNQFHTIYRKRRREVEDTDGVYAGRLAVAPEQGSYLELGDLQKALAKLSVEQREAILLIGAEG